MHRAFRDDLFGVCEQEPEVVGGLGQAAAVPGFVGICAENGLSPSVEDDHFDAVARHIVAVAFQGSDGVEEVILAVQVGRDEVGQQDLKLTGIVGECGEHRIKIRLLKSLCEQRVALQFVRDGDFADAPQLTEPPPGDWVMPPAGASRVGERVWARRAEALRRRRKKQGMERMVGCCF